MVKSGKTQGQAASQISPETDVPAKPLTLGDMQQTYGWVGTDIWGGIINEEYNRDLSGLKGIKKFDEMRKSDASVSALLLACSLPIRSAKRYIEPATDDDGVTQEIDRQIADFVEKALFEKMDTTWDQFLQECLTFLPFGFSVFEKVYYIKDNEVLLKKLAFRSQKTIEYWITTDGRPWIQQQLDTPVADWPNKWKFLVSIPWDKLILFVVNQEGDNYQGVSVLRPAYKHWYIKQNLEKFEAIKHQKQGVGVPLIYLPKGATEKDKEAALTIVEKFKTNEQSGVVMPWPKDSGWEFSFADLKAGDTTNMQESIKYHMREITKTVLAQFIELGNTDTGSRALGESQTDMFLNAIASYAKIIQNNINRYLIPELVGFNFNTDRFPKLRFEELGGKDMAAFSTTLAQLITAGVIDPDEELQRVVREQLGLPPKDEATTDDPNDAADDTSTDQTPVPDGTKKDMPAADDNVEDIQAHEHKTADWDCGSAFADDYYMSLSRAFNNRVILDIQKKGKDDGTYAEVKKKWYKFNDFEDESPRVMTFAERKVNFKMIKGAMNKYSSQLDSKTATIFNNMKKDLLNQIDIAVQQNDVAAIGRIKARFTDDFAQVLTDVQKEMFEIGKKAAATEMGVPIPTTPAETKGAMYIQNQQVVQKITNDMTNTAQSAAMQTIAKRGGSITDTSAGAAKVAVNEALTGHIAKAAWSINTLWISMSLNMWRTNIFEMHPEKVYAMQYSAILDENTTDRCLSLDGRIVKPWSTAFYEYSPPQHYNCRSVWVEVLEDEEFKPSIGGIPASIAPALTIDNTPSMSWPVVWKWSPALWILQEELKELEGKLELLKAEGKNEFRQWQYQDRIDVLKKALKK